MLLKVRFFVMLSEEREFFKMKNSWVMFGQKSEIVEWRDSGGALRGLK